MGHDPVDGATVRELCARYNRWGRWGPDDEKGALNLISADAIRSASELVTAGEVISCALPFGDEGPQTGSFGRTNPLHFMLQHGGDIALGAQEHLGELRYTDDAVYMPLQCGTQWDALSHIFHQGKMWNGYGLESVTSQGASRNAITAAADRVVGRGLLLDIPRHRGVPWVEAGEPIHGAELAECAADQGIAPQRGDIVLVRTGQIRQVREQGSWGDYAAGPAPGLGVLAAPWFCDNEIAAVATDTWGIEVLPNETPDIFQPLHLIMLVNAGMLIGEMFDLEKLAAACAADGRYTFLFAGCPLPFTRAVGSPVNPLAIR
jgi:kynurenine formamidase